VKRRFVVRPEARLELIKAAEWYSKQSRGLGAEFVRVIDAAFAAIQSDPLQFPVIDRPIRRSVVRRFPYTIMFTADQDEIVVLAVFHVRRDPSRWKDRV